MSLKKFIIERIHNKPEQTVWTATDFFDLGSRDAVDKTLQRLVNQNELRRIERGLYDAPKINSLTKQFNPPDYQKIIDTVARRDQVRVLLDGLTCANDLGFTNIVPGKIIVLTDGRLRPIKIQNLIVKFKTTAPSKLYWADKSAMRIVQALHWLKDLIKNKDLREYQTIKNKLVLLLTQAEKKQVLMSELQEGLYTLPLWMQIFLKEVFSSIEEKTLGN